MSGAAPGAADGQRAGTAPCPPKPGGTHPPLCPRVGWDTCRELEGLTWPCATPVGLEGTLVLQVWGAVDLGCCGCGDGAAEEGYPLCFGVLQVWGYQFSGLIQAQVEQPGLINH